MTASAGAAVVFDMDGILIDSEPLFREGAQHAARELGYELADATYAAWMGLPPRAVEAAVYSAMGADFPMAEFRARFRAFWVEHTERDGVPPQPGIPELLQALSARKVPMAVATSTQRDQALRSLELAGLRAYLPIVIAGNDVNEGKPAPEIFLRAADALAVDAAACIALEDSAVGVRAATAAGMLTIMVPDLHQPDAEIAALAHYVIPDTERAARVVLALFDSRASRT